MADLKKSILEKMESKVQKTLPLFHILLHFFTYFNFSDKEGILKLLTQESHEFRMLPLPYGLLPHEVIEVIDNERIVHGITKIFKFVEDFPLLDKHSLNMEKDGFKIYH
jgi:hypothetical protein